MDWWFIVVLGFAAIVLGVEFALRQLGFGRPLLFEKTDYGYRIRPSQRIHRFGRLSEYNEHGLRASPLQKKPPAHGRILCLGDSITNCGAGTDQLETWPMLLETGLRQQGFETQVLNASAGGWALENEAGWLRSHGLFEARILIIELGTHDLFQQFASGQIVGNHPSFPDRYPSLALIDVWSRYKSQILPVLRIGNWSGDPGTEKDMDRSPAQLQARLSTLSGMVELARSRSAEVIIVHVEQPLPEEPTDPDTLHGKRQLSHFAECRGIPLVSTAAALEAAGGQTMFRDAYHPNESGNRIIAECLLPVVIEQLSTTH